MRSVVGDPLGLSMHEAAEAILRVVNDNMAAATRLVSLERGFDPRDFTLVAFGGAGPLHAVELAQELNIPRVLIPHSPGILCAMGCQVAEVRQDFVQTVSKRLDSVDQQELKAILHRQAEAGRVSVVGQGVPADAVRVEHMAEMQYEGQTHSLFVDLDESTSPTELDSRLTQAYRDRYGVELEGYVARLVNLRTVVEGDRGAFDLRQLAGVASNAKACLDDCVIERRQVYFSGDWYETPVYDRHAVPVGARIEGPAIFSQADSTTVLPPGWSATSDSWGNLRISTEEQS
jgi:N-methylhydantoinase A